MALKDIILKYDAEINFYWKCGKLIFRYKGPQDSAKKYFAIYEPLKKVCWASPVGLPMIPLASW